MYVAIFFVAYAVTMFGLFLFSSSYKTNVVFFHWVHILFNFANKGFEACIFVCLALVALDKPKKAIYRLYHSTITRTFGSTGQMTVHTVRSVQSDQNSM